MSKKPKLTRAERLLERVRKNPSPTCLDPRQSDLLDLLLERRVRQAAFSQLDRIIRKIEEEGGAHGG